MCLLINKEGSIFLYRFELVSVVGVCLVSYCFVFRRVGTDYRLGLIRLFRVFAVLIGCLYVF